MSWAEKRAIYLEKDKKEMPSSVTESVENGWSAKRKSYLERQQAINSIDFNQVSATLKKELADVLKSGNFDKDKSRELVENYAGVQFKIFDENLKKGHTGIKPIGENLSNLFKAHGYDFGELYPDIAENFATGNIEGYAYGTSDAFKQKWDNKQEYEAVKDVLLRGHVAANEQREHERNADAIAEETKQKTKAFYDEVSRLGGDSPENRQRAAEKLGYLPSNVGFQSAPEEYEERKAAAEAAAKKIIADEGLFAATTMRDVMNAPDFEQYADKELDIKKEDLHGSFLLDLFGVSKNKESASKSIDAELGVNIGGLSEDAARVYRYLYNKYGEKEADTFLKGIKNTKNEGESAYKSKKLQEMEKGNPLEKTASAIGQAGYALGAGVEGLVQAGKGVIDTFSGDTEYFMPGMMQITTQKNKEKAGFAGKLFLGAAEGAPQVAGTAALGAINPALGAAFLGTAAYGSSYVDAINSGASKGQAVAMGVANAALEIALEKFVGSTISDFGSPASKKATKGLSKTGVGGKFAASFDDFIKAKPKRGIALKTAGNVFGNASSEFLEEYLAETAAPLLRNIFLGENGEFTFWSDEQREAGLIGFITGGILDGARGSVTLYNLTGGDYMVNVEKIRALSTGGVLAEYKAKFGEDITDPDMARSELLDSERFVAATVAMSEYAKRGLTYDEAIVETEKLGIDVSGFEEFTKNAYELGKVEAASVKTEIGKKLSYKGGSYADIKSLIVSDEATSYITDKMMELDGSISEADAKNAITTEKQRAFMESLDASSMSDFDKANAMKRFLLKEQALERMYTLGKMGLKFDVSMAEGFVSEADAYKAFTRGENARMSEAGPAIEIGSMEEVGENVADAIGKAERSIAAAKADERFKNAPSAPIAAEDTETFGNVKLEGGERPYDINLEVDVKVPSAKRHVSHVKMSTSDNSISDSSPNVNTVINSMGSEGVAVYEKIMGPMDEEAGTTQGKVDSYRDAIAYVYTQGKSGVSVKRSKAQPLRLTEINAVYDAGKKDAEASKNVKRKKEAKLIKDNAFKKARVSKYNERVLEGISRIVGRDIKFSDTLEGNAKIDLATGEIIISTKAKTGAAWAMIHEVFHAMRMDSPAEANKLIYTVLDILGKNKEAFKRYKSIYASAYFEEITDKDGNFLSNAADIINEEMAADIIGFVISDPDVLESITGQQRNVLRKFIDKLIKYFLPDRLDGTITPELRRAYKDVQAEAETIAKQFKAALEKQSEIDKSVEAIKKASGQEAKRSKDLSDVNFSKDKYFDKKIDKWHDIDDQYVSVGKVTENGVLNRLGVPSGKVYFDVLKIKKSFADHVDHLTVDILKRVPDLLNNPMVITEYKPGQNTNTISIYGDLILNGKPVVAGLAVSFGRGGNIISKIRTVHLRRDLKTQITDDSVLYLRENKKEINAWFQACDGIDVPKGGTQLGVIRSIDFADIIRSKEHSVNRSGEKNSRDLSSASELFDDDRNMSSEDIKSENKRQLAEKAFKPSLSTISGFSKAIDRWLSGRLKSDEYLSLGNTPVTLKVLGAENLPVIMSQNVIAKMTGGKHNISLDEIKRLPEAIYDPIMVFNSATVPDSFVIVTELEDKNGNGVVVALHLAKKQKRLLVNRVSSVYGKENIGNFIKAQIQIGNMKYINKEKSQQWATNRGLRLPKLVQSTTDNNNILQKEDIVNSILFKNDEIEQMIQTRKSSDDLSNADVKAIKEADTIAEQFKVALEKLDAMEKSSAETNITSTEEVMKSKDLSGSADKSQDKISMEMSDQDRTHILSSKSIVAHFYEGQADELISLNKSQLESEKLGLVKKAILIIAENFAPLNTSIDITDAEVSVVLSRSNLKESVTKEVTPEQLAKLLPVLKETLSNSIAIERHNNRYFFDSDTVYFDNLIGGYIDGDDFVPVRFGLKHSKTGKTTLYVVVDQNKVPIKLLDKNKKTEVVKAAGSIKTKQTVSRSITYSLSEIVLFVKSKDILRYFPDDMLDAEQRNIKWKAVAETIKRTNEKNDKRYAEYIATGNLRAANEMVREAAKFYGYTVSAYHGTSNGGFTWFDTYSYYSKFGLFGNGAYFTENKDIAEQYTKKGRGTNPQVYSVYLKITNPIDMDAAADVDSWNEAIQKSSEDISLLVGEMTNERAFKRVVEDLEYSEVYDYDAAEIIRNIFEDMGYNGITHIGGGRSGQSDGTKHRVWISFEGEQIKSADPVTYDDKGNVIPLSERFNHEKGDIRWSWDLSSASELFDDDRNMSSEDIKSENKRQLAEKAFKPSLSTISSFSKAIKEADTIAEQFKVALETSEKAEKNTVAKDGVRSSKELFGEVNKDAISEIRSIGRKNINDLTSDEVKRAEPFARLMWKTLKEKSPFFMAWFGDWRANDTKTIVHHVTVQSDTRGLHRNTDTGWDINHSSKVHTESHNSKASVSGKAFLPYIDGIIENAVLLNSEISDNKNENSIMFHSLYSVVNDGDNKGVIKLVVEEMKNPGKNIERRAYKLVDIEKLPASALGSQKANLFAEVDSINNISQLIEVVKAFDKSYNPKPSSVVVDENGAPKKVYHSTSEKFDSFDITKSRSWDGTPDYDLPGFYFSENYEDSAAYSGNVGEYYIKITKPYEGDVYSLRKEKGSYRAAYEYLIENGYDGVIIDELGEGSYEYIVLKDVNVKSATDNTVVTVFTPDTERNGYEFDYVEQLLESPDNYSIKEEKSTSDEGAAGEKAPNTFENEDALFTNSTSKVGGSVNTSNERKSKELFTDDRTMTAKAEKKAVEKDGVRSSKDITDNEEQVALGMDDNERYIILKNKKIHPQINKFNDADDIDFDLLENNIKSKVEKGLLKKFQEMGLLKTYTSIILRDISFEFTGKGFRKSLNSQESLYGGSKADFAKVVLNLQELLDSSILIETHTDKGKGTSREKRGLEQVYVLFSVLGDNGNYIPVQFEVQQYLDNRNRLYLAVALTKIETGVMGNTAPTSKEATSLLPISDISISEVFKKINPADENFLKYIPNQFLNEAQVEAKNRAIEKDNKKYTKMSKELFTDDRNMSSEDIKSENKRELLELLKERNLKRWGADIGGSGKAQRGEVLAPEMIIKRVEKAFGVPITSGGTAEISGKNYISMFRKNEKTITAKFKGDLPEIAHALGYYIDERLGIIDEISSINEETVKQNGDPSGYAKELQRILKEDYVNVSENEIREGFAEFVRIYLMDKETAFERTPLLTEFFEKKLMEDRDVYNAVNESAKYIGDYLGSDFSSRLTAMVLNQSEADKLLDKPLLEKSKNGVNDLYQNYVDKNSGIFNVLKRIGKLNLKSGYDPYVMATNFGVSASRSAEILTRSFVDYEGRTVGESFASILADVGTTDSEKYKLFNEYLFCRHAPSRLDPKQYEFKGEVRKAAYKPIFRDKVLNDAGKIADRGAELETKYPEFKALAQRVYRYQDNLLKYYILPSGGMSIEQYDELKLKYPNYVPLMRYSDVKEQSRGIKRGFANLPSPIKIATGGTGIIVSPLESIMRQTISDVNFYQKNRIVTSIGDMVTGKDGVPGIMERVYSTKELKELLTEAGENPNAILQENVLDKEFYRNNPYKEEKTNSEFLKAANEVLSDSDEVAISRANNAEAIRLFEHTPRIILDNVQGSSDLPVIINYSKLYLASRGNGALSGHYHNLGSDIGRILPKALNSPDAILLMDNGRINIISSVQIKEKNNLLVSVELDSTKRVDGKHDKYNVVVTVFDASDNYIDSLLREHAVSIEYEKEDLPQVKPRLHNGPAIINGKSSSEDIISQNDGFVNERMNRNDSADTEFNPIASHKAQILYAWKDGKKIFYKVHDKELYNSLANLTEPQLGLVFKISRAVLNLRKIGVTSGNILFTLSNFYRDFMTYRHNTLEFFPIQVFKYITTFLDIVFANFGAGKNKDLYEQFLSLGGSGTSIGKTSIDSLAKAVKQLQNRNKGIITRGKEIILDWRHGSFIGHAFSGIVDVYCTANEVIEHIPRFIQFKNEMAKHGDSLKAFYEANDVTTNFSRKGLKSSHANSMFMFFNASVQGLDKARRSYISAGVSRKEAVHRAFRDFMTGVCFFAAISFFNRDDEAKEAYKMLSEYTKRNYDCFYLGDGKFLKLPKERDLGIFRTAWQMFAEYMMLEDEKTFDKFTEYCASWFSYAVGNVGITVSAGNTATGPLLETWANKNYRGEEIVPEYLSMYTEYDHEKYDDRTSILSVKLAKLLYDNPIKRFDISPMTIDHIIKGYGGWFGDRAVGLLPNAEVEEEGYRNTIKGKFSNVWDFLGFKNRYTADARYSSDILNNVYNAASEAEIAIKRSKTGKNLLDGEKYIGFESYVRAYNKLSDGELEERRNDRYNLQKQIMYRDDSTDAVDEWLIKLYDDVGAEDIFYNSYPSFKSGTFSISNNGAKWYVTLDAAAYSDFCADIDAERHAVRELIMRLGFSSEQSVYILSRIKDDITNSVKQKWAMAKGVPEYEEGKKQKKYNEKKNADFEKVVKQEVKEMNKLSDDDFRKALDNIIYGN